jgi:hypothetical protein
MVKVEKSIYPFKMGEREILIARKKCSDLYDKLGDIEFML